MKVNLNEKDKILNCYVLRGKRPLLIGRQWLAEFGLWPIDFSDTTKNSMSAVLKFDVKHAKEKILTEFKELFGSTPELYNKRKIKLHIKDNIKPIALRPLHVPSR